MTIENKHLSMETDVVELIEKIRLGRRSGEIKKNQTSKRVLGMLYRLTSDEHRFVPRKIEQIKELYSFSNEEMERKFQYYKKRTWQELNCILDQYGLPRINLPEVCKADPDQRYGPGKT